MTVKKEYGFSYCEAIFASSKTYWHIRRLTKKGRCLGGGADTKALCGRPVSWDLSRPIDLPEEGGVFGKLDIRCCPDCYKTLERSLSAKARYTQRLED